MTTTQYRVVADIPTTDEPSGYVEVTSGWESRREWIVPMAERLETIEDAIVEVETREIERHTVSEVSEQ